jgi:hypothetical protein
MRFDRIDRNHDGELDADDLALRFIATDASLTTTCTASCPRQRGVVVMLNQESLLKWALVVSGVGFLLIYPLAIFWPSGWSWHQGAPYESQYLMMIIGVYATLGVFLIRASRHPQANLSLIWFTIWSSLVHAGIMAVQSVTGAGHMGHLVGDVPALVVNAVVLAVLVSARQKA